MNRKGVVAMLGVSAVLATGAASMANKWVQQRMGTVQTSSGTPVVVAAAAIPFGQNIKAKDLRMMDLPPSAVPEGSFNAIDEVVGRVSSQPLYAGEVLLQGRVAEHLGGNALAAVLEPGMRAISVRVDDVAGVAGFILPGNLVDVVSSRRNGGQRDVTSQTILEQVKVLAVDQVASKEQDGPVIARAVTLAVTAKQAERLFEATQEGKVQLTLRNPLDRNKDKKEVASAAPKKKKKRAAPAHRHFRVSVIRGTEKEVRIVHE